MSLPEFQSFKEAILSSSFLELIKKQKEKMKAYFKESVYFRFNDGLFRADKETILFAELLKAHPGARYVLLDINDHPIEIGDIEHFIEAAIQTYYKASNQYLEDWQELNTIRQKEKIFND